MKPARRVLFVCTGNICRSATAEHLLRHLSEQRGLGLEVRSCGTAAESFFEVPAVVRRLLAEIGVAPFEHRARLMTREALRWADIVLVMTQAHREHTLELFPEFSDKVRLLNEHAGLGESDVDDPMGRSDETYAASLTVISKALEALIAAGLLSAQAASHTPEDPVK